MKWPGCASLLLSSNAFYINEVGQYTGMDSRIEKWSPGMLFSQYVGSVTLSILEVNELIVVLDQGSIL